MMPSVSDKQHSKDPLFFISFVSFFFSLDLYINKKKEPDMAQCLYSTAYTVPYSLLKLAKTLNVKGIILQQIWISTLDTQIIVWNA